MREAGSLISKGLFANAHFWLFQNVIAPAGGPCSGALDEDRAATGHL